MKRVRKENTWSVDDEGMSQELLRGRSNLRIEAKAGVQKRSKIEILINTSANKRENSKKSSQINWSQEEKKEGRKEEN